MTAAAVVRDRRKDQQGERQRNYFEGARFPGVGGVYIIAVTADNSGAEVLEAEMLNSGLIPALTLMTHCSSYPIPCFYPVSARRHASVVVATMKGSIFLTAWCTRPFKLQTMLVGTFVLAFENTYIQDR